MVMHIMLDFMVRQADRGSVNWWSIFEQAIAAERMQTGTECSPDRFESQSQSVSVLITHRAPSH